MIDNHKPKNYTPLGYFPEDNKEAASLETDVTRLFFSKHYPHINMGDISDGIIIEYLSRGYVIILNSFEKKMDAFYDYILSQNLTEVEE